MNIAQVTTTSLAEAVWYAKNCCPLSKVSKERDKDGNQVFKMTFAHPYIEKFREEFEAGRGRVELKDLGVLLDRFNLLYSPVRMRGVL